MLVQVPPLPEGPLTEGALVGALAAVDQHVALKDERLGEGLLADQTLIRFIAGV